MRKVIIKILMICCAFILNLSLYSCNKVESNEIIEKNARGMVSFVNEFYNPYRNDITSDYNGIAIELKSNNNLAKFECKTDNGSFSTSESSLTQNLEVGNILCWYPNDGASQENTELTIIEIIAMVNDNIVGFAIIEIEDAGICYATLITSIEFPKINGKYQKITQDYVEERINTIKNEYNNIPII